MRAHPPLAYENIADNPGSSQVPPPLSFNRARSASNIDNENSSPLLTVALVSPIALNGRVESKHGACLLGAGSQITLVDRSAVSPNSWRQSTRRVQSVTGSPLNICSDTHC